ncbi:hypothetical protein HDV06_005590 [Boothiomyces sp. JEL0866]|nr:hypothetical protein HDV06_005590 [Boothiomyces sp. JEL0866]
MGVGYDGTTAIQFTFANPIIYFLIAFYLLQIAVNLYVTFQLVVNKAIINIRLTRKLLLLQFLYYTWMAIDFVHIIIECPVIISWIDNGMVSLMVFYLILMQLDILNSFVGTSKLLSKERIWIAKIVYAGISFLLWGGFVLKLQSLGVLSKGWQLYWDQYGLAAFGLLSQLISTWQAFFIYNILKAMWQRKSMKSELDLSNSFRNIKRFSNLVIGACLNDWLSVLLLVTGKIGIASTTQLNLGWLMTHLCSKVAMNHIICLFFKFVLLQAIFNNQDSIPSTKQMSERGIMQSPLRELAPTVIIKKELKSFSAHNE